LLPFIEQQNIYNGGGQPTIGGQMSQARAAIIRTYFCPSRRAPTAWTQATSWYEPTTGYPFCGTHGQTDYAGCAGPDPWSNLGVIVQTFNHDMGNSIPGTRRRQPIRLQDLIDGTSVTLVAGDKKLIRGISGFRGDDNEGYSAGWDHDVLRWVTVAPMPDDAFDGNGRFGGLHPGGFNALLGDGSVRFIRFDISCCTPGTTFYNLGHRSDGGVLGNDW
jgi:prepilin-type processing-associated H-X9-DG protein